MIELQLREAFALMKAGKKAEANSIVQAVLREDKRNTSAWWLLSMLLEDEDKIVQTLENLLALNPEHLGARKRLAQLRPEYAHLNPEPSSKQKTSDKPEDYWERLDDHRKRRKSGYAMEMEKSTIYGLIFGLVVAFGITALMLMLFFSTAATEIPADSAVYEEILADMPNTPEALVQAYFEAYYRENTDALYALTCPAYHPEIALMDESFNDPWAAQVSLDFSQTIFDLDESYSGENDAYVALHGITTIIDGAVTIKTDWDEVAAAEGYEVWGYYLKKIEGQWYVCPNA